MSDWICTNPDVYQYCKPVSDHIWWFCELRHDFKYTDRGVVSRPFVCRARVNLHDYSLNGIWNICSEHYQSFEQMVEQYGFREAHRVMAGCIFEHKSIDEMSVFRFDTEEEAIEMIKDLVE